MQAAALKLLQHWIPRKGATRTWGSPGPCLAPARAVIARRGLVNQAYTPKTRRLSCIITMNRRRVLHCVPASTRWCRVQTTSQITLSAFWCQFRQVRQILLDLEGLLSMFLYDKNLLLSALKSLLFSKRLYFSGVENTCKKNSTTPQNK